MLNINKPIYFYKKNEPYGEFSNFSEHPIYLDGTMWKTVEHYFQASKFLNDYSVVVQMAKTPMDAASLGRSRAYPIRGDWEVVKDEVMKRGVFKKVETYNNIRKLLLSTDNREIVEHTSNDYYWGDGGDGSGLNKLGYILMEARCYFREKKYMNDDGLYMLPPWDKFPDIQCYDMAWSTGCAEEYLIEWCDWFHRLSKQEKDKYKIKNPPPECWSGGYEGL